MANATPGGRYLNVATGTIDLGQVYAELVASAEKRELESETVKRYEEKFQIFLGIGMLLLAMEMVMTDRRRVPGTAGPAGGRARLPLMLLLGAVLLAACSGAAWAASAARMVEEGNRAFEEGDYDAALSAYEEASVEVPESPVLEFNKGAVYYRHGDYAKARERFQEAGGRSRDLALDARARYNLGNCAFREGERQRDSDLKKALASYEESIGYYQEALERDPELREAAENIEIARLVIKSILDELRKREEEAKAQQEAQQQAAEQLKELIERQEAALERNAALAEERRKEDRQETQDEVHDLTREQKDLQQDTRDLGRELAGAQQQEPSPADEARRHVENAVREQEEAAGKLDEERLEDAQPDQRQAADELRKALASLAGGQEERQAGGQEQGQQGEEAERSQAGAEEGERPEEPPEDQAAAMQLSDQVGDILDEEKENRERRRVRRAAGYRPVDKDW
jgi:Ca-activated chloride channel family protein